MAKELMKAAGKAALETALRQMLPTIIKRLDELQEQLREFRKDTDRRFEETNRRIQEAHEETAKLRDHVDTKFERAYEVINELGLRINTQATKLDTFFEFSHRTSDKVDNYIEWLVRVEEAVKSRRRRAG